MDEKRESRVEDAASSVSSHSAPLDEKNLEAGLSTKEATITPTPAAEESPELEKVTSKAFSAKEAQEQLTKIMTSGEGVEYPTGMKLNLISLALCLSVFLIALDNTIVSSTNHPPPF